MLKHGKLYSFLLLSLYAGLLCLAWAMRLYISPKIASAITVGDSLYNSKKIIKRTIIGAGGHSIETWNKYSKYYIDGQILIPAGKTLKIEGPGDIYFGKDAEFVVYGTLQITGGLTLNLGRSISPELIRALSGEIIMEDAHLVEGSSFFVDESGQINYIKTGDYYWGQIDYNDLIVLYQFSSLKITRSDTAGLNFRHAITAYGHSSINIDNLQSSGNNSWSYMQIYDQSEVTIKDSLFENDRTGDIISVFNQGIVDIDGSILTHEYTNKWNVSNLDSLTSSGRKKCLSSYLYSKLTIKNSDISKCDEGIFLARNVSAVIENNNITDNGISIENYSSGGSIKNNWWGNSYGPLFLFSEEEGKTLKIIKDSHYSGTEIKPIEYISNDFLGTTANTLLNNFSIDYGSNPQYAPVAIVPFNHSRCCSSILFIPGLQASRLYERSAEVYLDNTPSKEVIKNSLGMDTLSQPWQDILDRSKNLKNNSSVQIWEPNNPLDINKLMLSGLGESMSKKIYVGDIIKKTNIFGQIAEQNIYNDFVLNLDSMKANQQISDWQAFPYDWRMDPRKIVLGTTNNEKTNTNLLKEFLLLAGKAKNGRVTIVGHSYGGIIAKLLAIKLKESGFDSKIESVILVGSPENGTPSALSGVAFGYDQSILGPLILSKSKAVELSKNMLSAYMLLPNFKYLTNANSFFRFTDSAKQYFQTKSSRLISAQCFTMQALDFLCYKNYIQKALGLVLNHFNKVDDIHKYIAQNYSNLSSKTYSIVGFNIPTVSGLILDKTDFGIISNNQYSMFGDGTVVVPDNSLVSGQSFWVNLFKEKLVHKNIMNSASVIEIIKKITSSGSQLANQIESPNTYSAEDYGRWRNGEQLSHTKVISIKFTSKDSNAKWSVAVDRSSGADFYQEFDLIDGKEYLKQYLRQNDLSQENFNLKINIESSGVYNIQKTEYLISSGGQFSDPSNIISFNNIKADNGDTVNIKVPAGDATSNIPSIPNVDVTKAGGQVTIVNAGGSGVIPIGVNSTTSNQVMPALSKSQQLIFEIQETLESFDASTSTSSLPALQLIVKNKNTVRNYLVYLLSFGNIDVYNPRTVILKRNKIQLALQNLRALRQRIEINLSVNRIQIQLKKKLNKDTSDLERIISINALVSDMVRALIEALEKYLK